MYKPTISIIVVVFNDKNGLEATLDSIFSQKYENVELIVVDGGSSDGTKDVILDNALQIDRWVSQKDDGIYDAMNKGREMANGEYLWYVNAGDLIYSPHALEHIFNGNDKEYDIYYGDTLIVSQDGEIMGLRKKRLPRRLSWRSFRYGMVVCHQSIIIRKSITKAYDLRYKYSADYKWVLEALKCTKEIYNTGEILSVFKEGGTTTQKRGDSLKERFEIMTNYFGIISTLWSHLCFIVDTLKPSYRKPKLHQQK